MALCERTSALSLPKVTVDAGDRLLYLWNRTPNLDRFLTVIEHLAAGQIQRWVLLMVAS